MQKKRNKEREKKIMAIVILKERKRGENRNKNF